MLDELSRLARAAGAAIMDVYETCTVTEKADGSPVTEADERAEAIILAGLPANVPVVAEESVAAGRIPAVERRFFLVDPLDGTKEFIQRRGDFTVNIALIEDGVPVLGVVYAPAQDRMFVGDVKAQLAWADGRAIRVRAKPEGGIIAVASKSHSNPETEAYLAQYEVAEAVSVGSSLKFCLVAAGEADLYPRLGPTMEWDTAAGHAVLLAAGGRVLDAAGNPLSYGKPGFRNGVFVAAGNVEPLPLAPFMNVAR